MWLPQHLPALHSLGSGVSWNGERVAQEVQRRAALLQRLPVQGRWVLIAHGGSPGFVADLLAVWRAGGRAACVAPSRAADAAANVGGALAAVLVDGQGAAEVSGFPVLDLGAEAGIDSVDASSAATPEALDAPALMLWTRGSRGPAKAVVHTHRSLQARVALNIAHVGPRTMARTLCVLPTHQVHGLLDNLLTPLAAGAELFLAPSGDVDESAATGTWVRDKRISFISADPAFWQATVSAAAAPPPGLLARVHIGSAPLSAALWREVMRWSGTMDVAHLYGSSEACNWVAGVLGSQCVPEDGLVGRPWGGQITVLGEDGRVSERGSGEVLVSSPSLMLGYFGRDDLTAQVLRGPVLRSGDQGHIDERGLLRLTDRRGPA